MAAPIVMAIPLDPEALNRQMQAAAKMFRLVPRELMIPNFRLAFLVPAGEAVEVPFELPFNYVCTRRSPLRFESTHYSKDITVDIWVDEPKNKVNPYPMPLDHPFEVDFGTHYVKEHLVHITIENGTDVDATVTLHVVAHIMSRRLYDEWYAPIIRFAQEQLDKVAAMGVAARAVQV